MDRIEAGNLVPCNCFLCMQARAAWASTAGAHPSHAGVYSQPQQPEPQVITTEYLRQVSGQAAQNNLGGTTVVGNYSNGEPAQGSGEPVGSSALYVPKAAYEALKAQTIPLAEHTRLVAEAEQKAYEEVAVWTRAEGYPGAAANIRAHFCKPKECVMVQPCGAPFEAGLSVDGVEVARFSKASDADEYAALLRARLSKEGNRG